MKYQIYNRIKRDDGTRSRAYKMYTKGKEFKNKKAAVAYAKRDVNKFNKNSNMRGGVIEYVKVRAIKARRASSSANYGGFSSMVWGKGNSVARLTRPVKIPRMRF